MTPRCPCCGKACVRETRFEAPAMSNPSGRQWWACPDAPTITTTWFKGRVRNKPMIAVTGCQAVP